MHPGSLMRVNQQILWMLSRKEIWKFWENLYLTLETGINPHYSKITARPECEPLRRLSPFAGERLVAAGSPLHRGRKLSRCAVPAVFPGQPVCRMVLSIVSGEPFNCHWSELAKQRKGQKVVEMIIRMAQKHGLWFCFFFFGVADLVNLAKHITFAIRS